MIVTYWLPVMLCAASVAGLLLAEWRDSASGVWVCKPLASASFVATALVFHAATTRYGRWVLAGLLLCMLGDVLLIPRGRPRAFRLGVFAFLLGHVAFCVAFLGRPLEWSGVIAGGAAVGVALTLTWRWLQATLPGDMRTPVAAYLVVIGTMCALACGVTSAGGPGVVAAGALMFAVSDVSVARDRFVRPGFANRAWGLPMYYAAQLLIAASAASA